MIDLDKISTKPPKINQLQNKLYSNGRSGLLIILQSMDISKKDYTIKQIFSSANLQSFKNPTEDEIKKFFKPTILEAEP
tara:strand:- start:4813 stop:5049 length:237 start_codon:yes stop_codon:yes gene_type:complete